MPFGPVHEQPRVMQEDFLTRVHAADRRHYLDGIVTALPTESAAHRRLCRNLEQAIAPQCHASIVNLLVQVQPLLAAAPQRPYSAVGMFCYPDVAVVMSPPAYHDEQCRALTNPTVLIEVCSSATEDFDAGEKFQRYRQGLPSLQEYVLVAETRCEVGHYHKVGQGQWPLELYTDMDDVLLLNRIGCRLALVDVYRGVLDGAKGAEEPEKVEATPWQWYR
jgi:Uma2 family endonuclease